MIEKVEGGYYLKFGKKSCFKPDSCSGCPLFKSLKIEPDHTEFSKVLFIGEGPGKDERVKMRPFTGKAGQLIRAVAEDTGADKFGFGYTNIVLCEGGKVLEYTDPEALWQAIDLCTETFLWHELDELKPQLVVPAGNFPKSVILREERRGIGTIAGLLYKKEDWGYDFDTIPVHHPAYILYNPKMFEKLWDEINEVRLYFTQKPGPFHVRWGSSIAIKRLWDCQDVITVDLETTSFSPRDSGEFSVNGKTFHMGEILCMSLSADSINSYIFTPDLIKKHHKKIKELLETRGVNCHNGQFELPFLAKYGLFPELKDDTMYMSYAMDESPRHSLKRLSRRHLGLEDWSKVLAQYLPDSSVSYAAIPPKILYPYCGMDTAACSTLRPYLLWQMDEDEKRIYRDLLIPCANMFSHISYKGIRIDLKLLMNLRARWSKEKLDYAKKLRDYGIANPNSPYQISDALNRYEVVDYDAVTSKTNLEELGVKCNELGNEKGADLCNTVTLYRGVAKAIDTALYGVAKSVCSDARVHPDFKMFATVTGRLVISNPPLLNYPKTTRYSDELREIFIPDKGFVWCHRDQKQFELRVYCVVNNDRLMKDIFADGRDPHGEVMIAHMGIKKYNKLTKKEMEPLRVGYKATVFGVLYGRGEESIAGQFGIPVSEAREIISVIEALWSELPRYRKRIEASLNDLQEIVSPLGRKRRFPILTPENYHDSLLQAYNFPIQSTASDLNLLGMHSMWKSGYGDSLMPYIPIHDSIEYQVRESELDEIESWVVEILSSTPKRVLGVEDVNFVTDSGLGYNWMEASL